MGVRYQLALWAVCVGLAAGCNPTSNQGFDFTGQTASKLQQGSFSQNISRIVVENEFGNVSIELAEGKPGWRWEAAVWADSQPLADDYLARLVMDVRTEGDTQFWTLNMPDSTPLLNGVESNFTFKLPAGFEAKVNNAHGNVTASRLSAPVTIENRHGDVLLKELAAEVAVENAHGHVNAQQLGNGKFTVRHGNTTIRLAGALVINAAHGNVDLRQLGGTLQANVGHGNLVVEGVQQAATIDARHSDIRASDVAGNLTSANSYGSTYVNASGKSVCVRSSHGAVRLTMANDKFDSIDITNEHGAIDLKLPESTQASIQMKTDHGYEDTDIPSAANSSRKVKLRNRHGNIRVGKSA